MRTLGISAFVLAGVIATLSIIFVGLAYGDGWSGGHACSMAESLCRSPSLLAIPALVAMAWGLMLVVDE
jgi:exosortase/archaeosortase